MEMTKQRLGRYRRLQREIEMLENALLRASASDPTYDTVMSAAKFPYNKKPVVIMGMGDNRYPTYRARLQRKREECEAIERFIASVDDSTDWQILTWRYIEGKSIEETAELMNYSPSNIKKLLRQFFEKL